MKPYLYLIFLITILVLVHPAACAEIAYMVGPNGEKPVGYANITEYKGANKVSFTVSARGPESTGYKATRDVESIKDEITEKINRGNDLVRDKGLDLVGNKSGAQRIDQICSIYDYMVGNWTFVSDWKGLDEFQYSNYTLKKGSEVGSSGKGDCDDFSILLASLVESVGGTPRIVFAYSPDGGHAYTEVYMGKKDDPNLDRMLRWLRTAYSIHDVYIHEEPEKGDVWLNMDWWKDSGGANHPGGPFYQATAQIPMYVKEAEDKAPLTPIENLLPKPLFNYSPLQPYVDEPVNFDASASIDLDGKIENYEWDFGDGDSSHGIAKAVCRHSYSGSGKFMVNLIVTDNEGGKSTKTSEINVKEPLPEAIITCSPINPQVGEAITFDASQSQDKRGQITKYEWDFDDGNPGYKAIMKHRYEDSGTYNVNLTVTNDRGIKNSSTIEVIVSKNIEPIDLTLQTFPNNNSNSKSTAESLNNSTLNLEDANAWYRKGYSLYSQNKFDEAMQAYDKAIEINPQYTLAWEAKGYTLEAQNKFEDAVNAYNKIIELDPKDANAWYRKGYSLYSLNKFDEAIQSYDKAIEINPLEASYWCGKAYALEGQDKLDEAVQAYENAIQLDPKDASAWYRKGYDLEKIGRTKEANEAFGKADELGYVPSYQ